MSQIKHKEALYEIFDAEMASGQSLDGYCDEILKTNVSKPSGNTYKFICLSDFTTTPTVTGRVKDKFFVVVQDIICGGIIKERNVDGELEAEFNAWTLMRLVRTILRDNQVLASTTHPSGVAKKSFLGDARQEYVLYYDSSTCIHTLPLEIHLQEDDS
jgi:hypothetical protein